MAYRRVNRRRRSSRFSSRFTPGRRVKVPYSRGQNLPTYSGGKILHVYPTAQSTPFVMAASSTSPMSLTGGSGNCTLLNAIPRAGGMAGRTGYRIRMRTLLLTVEVEMPQTGSLVVGLNHQHPKLWVLYDKRPLFATGTPPSITDVFEGTWFSSFRAFASRDRFDVLYEKDIPLDSDTVWNGSAAVPVYGVAAQKRFNVRIPINRITSWDADDTTGALSAMHIGPLYLCYTSNFAFVSGQMPTATFNWKLSFDDLMV